MAIIDWPGIGKKAGEGVDHGIHLHPDFFSDLENYNKGGIMLINPGDIIEYEEPARIYHRYLVLEILKEDEQSIQCQCLVYTGSGCSTIPYTVWKHDSYQRTKVIGHINILLLSEASTVTYGSQSAYKFACELLKRY